MCDKWCDKEEEAAEEEEEDEEEPGGTDPKTRTPHKDVGKNLRARSLRKLSEVYWQDLCTSSLKLVDLC